MGRLEKNNRIEDGLDDLVAIFAGSPPHKETAKPAVETSKNAISNFEVAENETSDFEVTLTDVEALDRLGGMKGAGAFALWKILQEIFPDGSGRVTKKELCQRFGGSFNRQEKDLDKLQKEGFLEVKRITNEASGFTLFAVSKNEVAKKAISKNETSKNEPRSSSRFLDSKRSLLLRVSKNEVAKNEVATLLRPIYLGLMTGTSDPCELPDSVWRFAIGLLDLVELGLTVEERAIEAAIVIQDGLRTAKAPKAYFQALCDRLLLKSFEWAGKDPRATDAMQDHIQDMAMVLAGPDEGVDGDEWVAAIRRRGFKKIPYDRRTMEEFLADARDKVESGIADVGRRLGCHG